MDFTLKRPDLFPSGTTVGAYPRSSWQSNQPFSGAPQGAAADTSVADDHEVAFTGLTTGVDYVAVAQVGGVYKYVGFRAAGAPESRQPYFGAFTDGQFAKWDEATQRFVGDAPAGGGLTHVTEDAINSQVVIDWPVSVGASIYAGVGDTYAGFEPTGEIWLATNGGNAHITEVDGCVATDSGFTGPSIGDPLAPDAGRGILYFRTIGGKVQLAAQFPTGTPQVVATEP